jgi:sec-independent protein translocase protein TatC
VSNDTLHDPNDGDEAISPREKPMGFFEHLEELRGTLIRCAVVFGLFAALIGIYVQDVAAVLLLPWETVRADFPQFHNGLITNSPMGIFTMMINICVMGAVCLSLPFWFFFLAQFVAPALTKKELKVMVPTCMAAFVLFLGGAAFGYYLLVPSTVRVAYEMNAYMGVDPLWTADKYYSLLLWLVLGVGAGFEFPLLVVLAVYMGFIQVATLRKYRRHAIVVMFVIAAIVTPTPDPFNMTMFAIPLILLYEVAIWVSAYLVRSKGKATDVVDV